MENTNDSQPNFCSSTFIPNFSQGNREGQLLASGSNNNNNYTPNPNQSHSQYSPPQQHQQLRPRSVASSPHHSAASSPFQSSFPIPRMNQTPGVDHPVHPSSYAQSIPSTGPPPHSAPPATASSSYLDASSYLNMNMREVIRMDMDPLPMGGNMHMDLGILSADQHADLRLLHERERQRQLQHSQQQGHQRTLVTSSDLHGDGSKGRDVGRRKRDQSDEGSEPGSSNNRGGRTAATSNRKQRGRPRLDTKDENAADRRRTQIRLAQRAYRLRKETTISSLRTRVKELETAIDGMQHTFLELHDSAMSCLNKSGPPEHIQPIGMRLKELTEKFLRLANTTLADGESAAEEDAEGESMNDDDSAHSTTKKRRRSEGDGSPDGGGLQTNGSTAQLLGGYQVTYGSDNGGNSGSGFNSGHGESGSTRNATGTLEPVSQCSGSDAHDAVFLSAFESNGPSYSSQGSAAVLPYLAPFNHNIPPELDTYSYSFHETTFSRRLHRAILENAYWLMTSPHADQRELERVFAYTFCYISKEELRKSLELLLKATKNESLHLYDYAAAEVRQLPRKPLDYGEMLASDTGLDKSEPSRNDSYNCDLRAEAYKTMLKLGVNQKYLRPDDVERIITDMGILSTTDATVMDPSLEVITSRSGPEESNTGPIQPYSPKSMTSSPGANNGLLSSPPMSSNPPTHNSDATPPRGTANPFSKNPQSSPVNVVARDKGLFDEPHTIPAAADEIDHEHSLKVIEGVKKYFNIDILVKELVNRGICLGRFPGFKKSDVLVAVKLASTQIY